MPSRARPNPSTMPSRAKKPETTKANRSYSQTKRPKERPATQLRRLARTSNGEAKVTQAAKRDRGMTKRLRNTCGSISNRVGTAHTTTTGHRTDQSGASTQMEESNRSSDDRPPRSHRD